MQTALRCPTSASLNKGILVTMIKSRECLTAYSDATLRALWSKSCHRKKEPAKNQEGCSSAVKGSANENTQLSIECLVDAAFLMSQTINNSPDAEGAAFAQKSTFRALVNAVDTLISFLVTSLKTVVSYIGPQLLVKYFVTCPEYHLATDL